MKPEESEKDRALEQEEKKEDPRQEVETVTSKNDNMEPLPNEEQLNDKKK